MRFQNAVKIMFSYDFTVALGSTSENAFHKDDLREYVTCNLGVIRAFDTLLIIDKLLIKWRYVWKKERAAYTIRVRGDLCPVLYHHREKSLLNRPSNCDLTSSRSLGPRLFVGNETNPVAHCSDLRWSLEGMIDDSSGTVQKFPNFVVKPTADLFQSKINSSILNMSILNYIY